MNKFQFVIVIYLVGFLSSVAVALEGRSAPQQFSKDNEHVGATEDVDGSPIGGGQGYIHSVKTGDYRVSTKDQLFDALGKAKPGQIVYVEDSAKIDLTGYQHVRIPSGVTLASGRGKNGSKGALIFSSKLETFPMFWVTGDNVRVTGIRLQGPDPERRAKQMSELRARGAYYDIPNSRGISTKFHKLEIDNCELWGWSHAAVHLVGARDAHIHHNFIHHNQRWALGYGVVLDKANALIEANIFDWNRDAIAATGARGTSYEARYNVVMENISAHGFDMHGGEDRKDGTNIAGDWIKIHHNTFYLTLEKAITIRGRPINLSYIHHNCFREIGQETLFKKLNAFGNFEIMNNQIGSCVTVGNSGRSKLNPPDRLSINIGR